MQTTIRYGSKNSDVKALQELLNTLLKPSPNLKVDGKFGKNTDAAVKKIQTQLNIGIDGIVGRKTWQALEAGKLGKPIIKTPKIIDLTNHWMQVAQHEIGQKEISGKNHNPKILAYHASTSLKALSDEVPWCSSFVNWVLKESQIKGTNSAAASSWLLWGEKTTAKNGAITIIRNAKAANSSLTSSGNHVGFLLQETATHYELLGGNQRDQVKPSMYPKTSWTLLGYRWPQQNHVGN